MKAAFLAIKKEFNLYCSKT